MNNVKSFADPNLEFDLAFHTLRLLNDEPFFARISLYLRKKPNYHIPTLGVRFDEENLMFEMVYNPKFLAMLLQEHGDDLGFKIIRAALMHEFYHCALGHLTNRIADRKESMAELNWAQDLAINSLPNMIDIMSKFTWAAKDQDGNAIIDPSTGQPVVNRVLLPQNFNLPNGESFEWYLNNIPKEVKQKINNQEEGKDGPAIPGERGSPFSPHDRHDEFVNSDRDEGAEGKISDAAREIAASKMKEIVEKAVKECDKKDIQGGNGWGTVPQEMRKTIRNTFKSQLDPKSVLRYFIKTSERADRRSSVTKINKRWKYIHPGRRWNRRPKIAISMDMSGSVSDAMLTKFFGWLNEFAVFADFTVIPFDYQVFEDKVFVWKKGQKKPAIRVLCGGTDFNAPTEYVNKGNFDGHIILTDLCAPTPKRSKVQRMWVTTKDCLVFNYLQTKEKILCVD